MLTPGMHDAAGPMARFQPNAGSSFPLHDAGLAVECVADLDADRPVIVEVWDGMYGSGFYALDIGFDDATRDQLRWECFGDARSEHPMDGVLVIDPSLADSPFEPMDGRIWLMEASWGSRTPIEGMIVAAGVWDDGGWQVVSTSKPSIQILGLLRSSRWP